MNRTWLAGWMLLTVALLPASASAQAPGPWVAVAPPTPQPAPIPHEESRPHIGLAISGGVLLGVSWLVHALVVSPLAGCDLDSCQSTWGDFRLAGAVPLAGPWIQLAAKPTSERDGWMPYLVIDGLLQTGGLVMLILGLAIRETTTVYGRSDDNGPSFVLAPSVTPEGGGLQVLGRF